MIIPDKKPTDFKSTKTETLEKDVSRLVTSVLYFHFAISFAHGRVSVAQWKSIRARNPKVWGSIPYEKLDFFLYPTLVTRRKKSFFISLQSSKLTISLILFISKISGQIWDYLAKLICLHFVINRFVLAFQTKRWRMGAVTTFKKKKLLLFD